jgi:transketolase
LIPAPETLCDHAGPVSTARRVRLDIIEMIRAAGSGHPGGSLSCVEILVQLYFHEMRIRPSEPGWTERDRFVLSKGHACPALYSVLARRGFFDPSELATLRRAGSRLQGHPDSRRLPGLDASTGSLGQGFGLAVGMARGLALAGSGSRVFCLLGDGELQEGCVWESASSASHAGLPGLVAVVDCNGLQLDGPTAVIKSVEPMAMRWQAFGWRAIPADGHSFPSLERAFAEAEACRGPAVVLARTTKGRGVSFMENECQWHGRCPTADETGTALREIEEG